MRILSERTIIAMAGTRAPMKALTTIPASPATDENDMLVTIAETAPKHAPEEIPVLYGSASGLTISACIRTPHAARPDPASIAATTCGMAVFHM